jgi:TP901 family phage tail tape measure protein
MATNTEKIVVQVVVQGQKDLENLNKKTKDTSIGFNKMTAGVLGAVTAFRQINQFVSNAVKTFRDFEFQMAKVRAITGASNRDFLKLSKTSQDLGRSTFFTAQQVAELQTNFGKLGFSTKEILNAQEATLNLATATDSDLARAAIVAGAAVRGFSLDAKETTRVADVMAVAFTSSALDIEKFQTSMTKVSPIAAGANISLEATTAVMGTLTDAGIEASIAGTSLRNIFLKMQDPASDLSKHLGFTVNSSEDLQKALDILNEEGLSNAEMMQLVDLRQVAAFQTMINGSKNISDLTFELEQGTGAAGEMADIVGDNLEGAFKRLTSAWQGLQIVITESVFGKGLQKFIDGTAQLFNNFTSFIEEPIEETLNKDRIAMNALAMETMQLAEGTDERRLAIIELQKKYPEYFANLDSEKTKNDELKGALELANDQYVQRIILKQKEAEIDNLSQEQAKQSNIIEEESLKARQAALKIIEQEGLDLDITNMKLEEYRKIIRDIMVERSRTTGYEDDPLTVELSKSAIKVGVATKKFNELKGETINLREEYKKLKEEFKIGDGEATEGGDDGSDALPVIVDKLAEETEALKRKLREDINAEKEKLIEKGELTKENKKELDQIIFDLEQAHLKELLKLNIAYGEDTSQIQAQILDNELEKLDEIAKKHKKTRKDQIDDIDDLGDALVQLAGENEKLNKIREVGVAITQAAAAAESVLKLQKTLSAITEGKLTLATLLGTKAKVANTAATTAETVATGANTVATTANTVVETASIAPKVASGAAGQTKLPFPLNIVAVVATLALLSRIVKSFGNGGVIDTFAHGGMVHGRSHAQGGEKFAVGGRVVELEGGEAVINKRSTAMFRNQLSAMNVAGGGVKFADGGLMNMPSFAQSQFNATSQAGMMGAIGQGGKVVVVESDISDVQNTVSVIESEATF